VPVKSALSNHSEPPTGDLLITPTVWQDGATAAVINDYGNPTGRRDMVAVIVGYARSPFTPAHKGALTHVRPEDFSAPVVRELLSRCALEGDDVEDLLLGCAYPEGEQGLNIGRIVTYLSGLPVTVPGSTINRLCGSSMQAIHTAAGAIMLGAGECYLCGGVETMSRVQRGGFNRSPHPQMQEEYPEAYIAMGITAENVAQLHSIPRIRQEEFALASHQKAATARDAGRFDDEMVVIDTDDGEVSADGCIRADTSLEKMAGLRPAFLEDGVVTAATSSPLTDGAAFVVVTSEEFAADRGLSPLARIISTAVVGVPPEIMGIGPVPATRKALDRAGLTVEDMDVIELNEAFSSQSLAVIDELGLDESRLNLDGGAIAIGHPLGASGARVTGKAAAILKREGGRYALATMCIGGGMGIATVLASIDS
jgi:acetyl-CoA acyltransferase